MLVFEYIPDFIHGFSLTALASVMAFAGALALGTLGALARQSKFAPVRIAVRVYVEVFRNTPVLVQLFMIFFGLPAVGVYLPAFAAGTLTLALNGGAYLTETLRTGIRSIPAGQLEAAKTLGLGKTDTFLRVIAPQAYRTMYPPIVSEFLLIILTSSLLSTIAVNELTGVALIVSSQTFESMATFGMAMMFYLLLTNTVAIAAAGFARFAFRAPLPSQSSSGALTRRNILRLTRRTV